MVNVVQPIFKEYIKFLQDNDVNLELKEGYYWLDNQIIKAFDKQGNIHKIARIRIDDNLKVSYTTYKRTEFEIESWQETVYRHTARLIEIENNSLELINTSIQKYKNYKPIILSSGGKDSSIVSYLVRQIVPDAEIIFNNTSLDCADTYKHIKSIDNVQILNPKEGFYQWRERLNFIPTRFARACCGIFKEGELINQIQDDNLLFFLGMRNEESNTRANYQDYWKNEKWTKEWQGVLPIRRWSELDVWLYILWKNIEINTKYMKGYSRVGCAISCPFYTKSTWVLDKYWYPTMYERWQEILKQDFIKNNKWLIMNCTLDEYKTKWNGGVVREEPTDEVIKEFAEYNKLDFEVAKKYFGYSCIVCNKKIKSKEVLAMNMKYFGRNINKHYCKKHLQELLNMTNDEWIKTVEDFKMQGCSLF